ncbi:MAG: tetratricopeptide repeat protein, partial [Chloroflexi bacterium]|nr:tetratricopeptide repeat protein [Chloroflexota bacterium]
GDMQRLDWKQALRVYEQIRTLTPEDSATRKQLVELHMTMGQFDKAMSELENYLTYLENQRKPELGVEFLEDLIKEHDDQPILKRALAAQLHAAGRSQEAVNLLDTLGEGLMAPGNLQGAMEVINQIILMNPPNVGDYKKLLVQMQKG